MKFFAVLLLVAIAVGCQADGTTWQERGSSSEEEDYPSHHNNWQTDEQVDQQVSSILAASQQDVAAITQNQKWNNFATANPEAAPYQQKIVQRLQNTPSFASKQNVQQNIMNLALEKLNVCKMMAAQQPSLTIDKSCLGRFTGQMMQLISAIENVSRNHPNGGSPTGAYPTGQY